MFRFGAGDKILEKQKLELMTDLATDTSSSGYTESVSDKWSDRPHLGPKRSSILQELFKIRRRRQDSGEADIGSDERSGFNSKRGGHERTPLIIVPLQQDLSLQGAIA